MKIDKNSKEPLYAPSEVPKGLRGYDQAPKSQEYRKNYDKIKWNNDNADSDKH